MRDDGKCLVCKRQYSSDLCPHTWAQQIEAKERIEFERRVRKIVREELIKAGIEVIR